MGAAAATVVETIFMDLMDPGEVDDVQDLGAFANAEKALPRRERAGDWMGHMPADEMAFIRQMVLDEALETSR